MPPLTSIHAFEAVRTTAGGKVVSGANRRSSERKAMLASALPSCDGGRPKVKTAPPTAGGKEFKTDENGAWGAGGRKARFCPTEGQGRAFSCACRWRVQDSTMRQ